MTTAQKRLNRRFPKLSKARWRKLGPAVCRQLQNDQPLVGPSAETCNPPRDPEVAIPDDMTPAAKAAIAQLMAVNSQSECRAQTLQVENSVLKDRVGRSESQVRVLKSMLKVVVGAMG
jgi:hypothetical protein